MGRVAFYRRASDLDELKLSVSQAKEELKQVIVETKNEIIRAIPGRIAPTDVTPEAFICIRVLSQVQDLVTDKDKNCEQNNRTLERLRKSAPFAEASKLLEKRPDRPDLVQRFQQAFRGFATGEFKELAERLVEIQDLNSDLVRYLAPNAQ